MIIAKRKAEEEAHYYRLLGAFAQLALVAAILLGRFGPTGFDFLIGLLYGFSMVGNLAFLINIRKVGGSNA